MTGGVPVIELFVREPILSFEVDGKGNVVGGGGGEKFAPEEELISVG